MNSIILTGKYNKEYRLHVARQLCMLCKTLLLCLFLCMCETKQQRVMRLHTRVYGTPNTGALRIHSDELKNSSVFCPPYCSAIPSPTAQTLYVCHPFSPLLPPFWTLYWTLYLYWTLTVSSVLVLFLSCSLCSCHYLINLQTCFAFELITLYISSLLCL